MSAKYYEIKGKIAECDEVIQEAKNTKSRLKNEVLNALNEPLNYDLLFGLISGLKSADTTITRTKKDLEIYNLALETIKKDEEC